MRPLLFSLSVFDCLRTQNIHATFELQGLFDDVLRLLGNVSNQAVHSGGVDILDHHLNLLCDCLDLSLKEKQIKGLFHDQIMRIVTNTTTTTELTIKGFANVALRSYDPM